MLIKYSNHKEYKVQVYQENINKLQVKNQEQL